MQQRRSVITNIHFSTVAQEHRERSVDNWKQVRTSIRTEHDYEELAS
jgi:hypothetical protein